MAFNFHTLWWEEIVILVIKFFAANNWLLKRLRKNWRTKTTETKKMKLKANKVWNYLLLNFQMIYIEHSLE